MKAFVFANHETQEFHDMLMTEHADRVQQLRVQATDKAEAERAEAESGDGEKYHVDDFLPEVFGNLLRDLLFEELNPFIDGDGFFQTLAHQAVERINCVNAAEAIIAGVDVEAPVYA